MKRVVIIILTALLVLSAFVSCNEDKIIDDEFSRTVTFDANGGQGTMEPQQMTTRTLTALALNKFTLTDHHFHGWNTKADGSGLSYGDGEQVSLTEDVTLYAMWEHDKAFITFDKNGGAGEMRTQIVLTNTPAELYANEYGREGYGFIGWNTKADGSGKSYRDKAEITVTTDTTLYAQWTDQTVTVTFYPNGGEGEDYSQDIFAGAPTALVAVQFTKEDYHFVNWDTTAEGEGHAYGDGAVVTITEDLELYAQWSHDTVKVTFDANGGTGEMKDQVVDTNTPTALNKEAFIKTDHHFTNWDTTAAGEGDAYGDGEKISISKDTTLYAQWAHDTAKITFDANGGEGTMEEQEIDTNTPTAIAENEFEFEGRTFTYWNTEKDGSGTCYADKAEITIEADITLYAQWDKVTITFRSNGGKGDEYTQIVSKDTETELVETTFIKYGYEFDHWNTRKDDTGTSFAADAKVTLENDLVLYAIWEKLPIIFIDENTEVLIGGESDMIRKDVTIEKRLTIDGTGDVTLILPEGKTLTLSNGLNVVSGQSLVIEGEGTLTATGSDNAAAIGGGQFGDGGDVTINGGTVNATGGIKGAGIGGGQYGNGGDVTINGGSVNATGGSRGAGIGGGQQGKGGDVTLNGGTVTAIGGDASIYMATVAGIGAGDNETDSGTIAIGEGIGLYGGPDKDNAVFISAPTESYEGTRYRYMKTDETEYATVTFNANGGTGTMADQLMPKGIDAPLSINDFEHDTLFFDGWALTAEGEVEYADEAVIALEENTSLYAHWVDAVRISADTKVLKGGVTYTIEEDVTNPNRLSINGTDPVTLLLPAGKTLTLTNGLEVLAGQSLIIDGEGSLAATGTNYKAGIGGGSGNNYGSITINGGNITATGSSYAAGIGGGEGTIGGSVTINGGTVTATGGEGAVGIGGESGSQHGGTLELDDVAMLVSSDNTTWVAYDGTTRTKYMKTTDAVTITFKPNGAEETEDVIQYAPSGYDVKLAKNTFTHETLFFAGWALTAEGEAEYADQASVNLTEDTTLYAKWVDVIALDDTYGGEQGKKLVGGLRYTISDDLTLPGRLAIDGTNDVTLILPEGKTLTLSSGLEVVSGQSLVIEGEGTLTATGGEGAAGIGGGLNQAGGTVTINGGTVNAVGGFRAAGIGGGDRGAGGTVAINGATVTATGGDEAVGIGKGKDGSGNGTLGHDGVMMLISDDGKTWEPSEDDTRTRYMEAAIVIDSDTTAIGGGNIYTLDDVEAEVENRITVSGTATIHLVGNMRLIAYKGINVAEGNTLILYGDNYSTLAAVSLPDAAAIGGSQGESCGTIIIYGGIVQATKGKEAEETVKAIGAGPGGTSDGTLTLVKGHALWGDNMGGNTVIMEPVSSASESYTGERYAYMDAIHVDMLESSSSTEDIQLMPGAYSIKDDLVTIEGRLVVNGAAMFILPDGKTLNAKRGIHVGKDTALMIDKNGMTAEGTGVLLIDNVPENYAGIGGNSCEEPGYRNIWINGGTIDVTGGGKAAGIGGGYLSDGGYIEINGGTVTARGGDSAAGIGGGFAGSGSGTHIFGGTVIAIGGSDGADGIGKGEEGTESGVLELGADIAALVSTDNVDWTAYDGSTRTRYMESGKAVTVTFDKNGGEGTMEAQTVLSGIAMPLNANSFTHESLNFAGWATSSEGDVVYADEAVVNLTEDTTLYAKWIDVITLDNTYGGPTGKKLTGGLRYTIADDLALSGRLYIDGTNEVTLILPEGKTLTLSSGLEVVSGQSLVIEGEGSLNATGGTGSAGIGGDVLNAGGTVTINGGTVTAQGGDAAAGIGGGDSGNGGTVTINGGTVTATGGASAAGIGGGSMGAGGTVTINDGSVFATGGSDAVGIGAGDGISNHGTLTIGAGYVLTGGSASADTILLGPVDAETTYTGDSHPRYMKVSKPIVLTSSTTVWSDGNFYTLGDTDVTIDDRVTVTGSVTLILPAGKKLTASKGITVTGTNSLTIGGSGTLSIPGTEGGAGIGGDVGQPGGIITITGGNITAKASSNAAGIGGSSDNNGGTITITGGTVNATGGQYAAGIGGGRNESGGTITITGGTVNATGGQYAAGIGGGNGGGSGGTITITGGSVTASGAMNAAGIGGGSSGDGGTITITGGSVTASGGMNAAGIGKGTNGSNGTLKIGTGVHVYKKGESTAYANGPQDNVTTRYRNMTVTSGN